MFSQAIVRRPARSMVEGITSAPELGKPDYGKALAQHDAYIEALEDCGVVVSVLEADEAYPDSCSWRTRRCSRASARSSTALAPRSRQGEEELMEPVVRGFYPDDRIARIVEPGTLEGGDVMMVGRPLLRRRFGAHERGGHPAVLHHPGKVRPHGSVVPLEHVLHLKTGVNYLENNTLLVAGEFVDKPAFAGFDKIVVPEDEAYAGELHLGERHRSRARRLSDRARPHQEAGYRTITVDVSEFRKLDGGLSCLSLRF